MKGAGGSGYRSRFPDPQEDAPQSSRVQTGLGEVLAASSVRAETGPEGCGSRLRGDTPVLTTSRIPEARTSREDVCAAGPRGGAGGGVCIRRISRRKCPPPLACPTARHNFLTQAFSSRPSSSLEGGTCRRGLRGRKREERIEAEETVPLRGKVREPRGHSAAYRAFAPLLLRHPRPGLPSPRRPRQCAPRTHRRARPRRTPGAEAGRRGPKQTCCLQPAPSRPEPGGNGLRWTAAF